MSNNCESSHRSHLARAIRKYGTDVFTIEKIDEAFNKKDLNDKEIYWISYYNSHIDGYNMTDGGEGGNTYASLSASELSLIKDKISKAICSRSNGMSNQIKCKSIKTGNEYFFRYFIQMLRISQNKK